MLKVIYDDFVYKSFYEFCKAKKVNYRRAGQLRRAGRSLDEVLEVLKKEDEDRLAMLESGVVPVARMEFQADSSFGKCAIVYGNRTYKSLNELCGMLKINYSTVYGRLKRGHGLAYAVEHGFMRGFEIYPFSFAGVNYVRLSDVALDLDIDYLMLCDRVRMTRNAYESVNFLYRNR